ncbi:MAG: SPOR domain-containing protein [Deltaproteobacteria bacterium]
MNSMLIKFLILAIGIAAGAYLSANIISAPSPQREEAMSQIISGDAARYALEIAAFPDGESALGLLDTLRTRGYFAYIQAGAAEGRFRVMVGAGMTEAQARDFASKFGAKEQMRAGVARAE